MQAKEPWPRQPVKVRVAPGELTGHHHGHLEDMHHQLCDATHLRCGPKVACLDGYIPDLIDQPLTGIGPRLERLFQEVPVRQHRLDPPFTPTAMSQARFPSTLGTPRQRSPTTGSKATGVISRSCR